MCVTCACHLQQHAAPSEQPKIASFGTQQSQQSATCKTWTRQTPCSCMQRRQHQCHKMASAHQAWPRRYTKCSDAPAASSTATHTNGQLIPETLVKPATSDSRLQNSACTAVLLSRPLLHSSQGPATYDSATLGKCSGVRFPCKYLTTALALQRAGRMDAVKKKQPPHSTTFATQRQMCLHLVRKPLM